MTDTPRISRQFSQRSVMEAIVQGGPISRASIAKLTGLSKQTISEIVRDLEEDGWVRETGRTSGHIGRTAVTYELVVDAAYIIAVDLGGTKVRVAVTDLAGQIVGEDAAPTDARGGMHLVTQISDMALAAATHAKVSRERLRLAVVGVPGAPDNRTGRILLAPNIRDFDKMDVLDAFRQAFGFDVLLENDVNLAALGESWQGQGQGIDNLAYVALGTGIGSGLILGGTLVRGAANAAGEMGFLPIGADPFEQESLRVGAYERAVATYGIIARYEAATGEKVDVPAVFERAAAGDKAADAVLDDTARQVACGIAAICAIANPQLVILGGSIGLRPEILERARRFLPLCFPYPVEIASGELGSRAALVGATAVGLTQLHNTLFGVATPNAGLSLPPTGTEPPQEAVE
ncbi:predicted NBD/HSP70 family sugar kinase [Rhizobium subbaraonis]|uniref:Predicted NBD/HSP70 family sugar kinase n=1 Tax=Rhizobium subbaraonis TaxID=908946 RepID=A0A285V224_9HYPH|nr:ROK family transcriptional regulator [Rhizobium subbaraonis]SOC48110.1 predicted NBD/HSP70 family sugar kinase [Rhizobium subbaraonis]